MQQIPMIVNAMTSRGDHSSEIQRLTSEVSRLSGKVDWWNTTIIVMMVCAAVAAVGLVAAQFIAFKRAGDLANAQALLSGEKERQSAESIAGLNREAEQLKHTNLELQKQIIAQGPRVNLLYGKTAEGIISALRAFPNQKSEVRYASTDFNQFHVNNEAMGTAMRLQYLLAQAHWDIVPVPLPDQSNGTAIWVSIRSKAPESTVRAANKLLDVLRSVPLKVNDKPVVSDAPKNAKNLWPWRPRD